MQKPTPAKTREFLFALMIVGIFVAAAAIGHFAFGENINTMSLGGSAIVAVVVITLYGSTRTDSKTDRGA